MLSSLLNKTILITGGTSRLGSCLVKKALQAGANVFFTYYKNQKAAEELRKLGAIGYQLDLADARQIDETVKNIKSKISHLDILIHNAAEVRDRTIQNLTEEDWDRVLAVNLKAPYYLTKKLLPLLFKRRSVIERKPQEPTKADASASALNRNPLNAPSQGRGEAISGIASPSARNDETEWEAKKIFFVTSRAAVMGGFGISNYAAAKAGLIGLTKSLAQELGKKQILVNAVNPGFMISGMTENLPETVLKHHLELSAVNRYSNPEEVADFLLYLSSDQMMQVSGQVFHFESRKIS